MSPSMPAVHPPRSMPGWVRAAYGFGAVAYGVKDNGFSYFLLLFYSQVIGVNAGLVGLALAVALAVDAFADLAIGYWSDNVRSRWGRRHPFMYAAAIPVAASYFLLWSPPAGWPERALFWYLLLVAVFVRVAITIFETPNAAMAPELTEQYDERSSLLSYRFYFGWTGGNLMSALMFLVLFPRFAADGGQFNRAAYQLYGVVASGLILLAMTVSAAGTHSRIPFLKPAPAARRLTLKRMLGEIRETFATRSFMSLFISAVFGSVATGLATSLAFYLYSYFWGFSAAQQGIIMLGVFASAVIGSSLAPVVTRTFGKKRAAIAVGLVAFLGSPLPIVLHLLGLLPSDRDIVFRIVLLAATVDVGLIVCYQILTASMMADLAEQAELATGRRSEGVFSSAMTFVRKLVSALGVMAASLVLALAGIRAGTAPAQVPAAATFRLGALYVPIVLALWMTMIAVMSTYRLSRADHEDTLRRLAAARTPPSDHGP